MFGASLPSSAARGTGIGRLKGHGNTLLGHRNPDPLGPQQSGVCIVPERIGAGVRERGPPLPGPGPRAGQPGRPASFGRSVSSGRKGALIKFIRSDKSTRPSGQVVSRPACLHVLETTVVLKSMGGSTEIFSRRFNPVASSRAKHELTFSEPEAATVVKHQICQGTSRRRPGRNFAGNSHLPCHRQRANR